MTIAPAEFFGSGATRHTEPPRTERVTPTGLARYSGRRFDISRPRPPGNLKGRQGREPFARVHEGPARRPTTILTDIRNLPTKEDLAKIPTILADLLRLRAQYGSSGLEGNPLTKRSVVPPVTRPQVLPTNSAVPEIRDNAIVNVPPLNLLWLLGQSRPF